MELTVERVRGDTVESRHLVSVAVVDRLGLTIAYAGDADRPTLARSAAKPFQAIPLVEDGVAEAFAMSDGELALACASHSSERRQVEIVRGLLARLGLHESDLACGPHRPLGSDLANPPIGDDDDQEIRLVDPSPLASNCSGKHTGMLALARHHGWAVEGYHQAGHPVQRRVKSAFAEFTGVAEAAIVEAVDGCGVVAFGVPLSALAGAYAKLATDEGAAARAVVHAMMAHPELVAGERRLGTELMRAFPGAVLAKVGAEGVYGAALLDRGVGLALKVEDGHAKAAMIALVAVLDGLGLEPPVAERVPRFAEMPIVNTRCETVGKMRAVGKLTFV